MSVPIIVSIGEDALKAVPDSYREAGLALGATRWQIVYRVLLPAAQERPAGGGAARRRPRGRRDDGRADGHRPRRADSRRACSTRSARSPPTSPPSSGEAPAGSDHYRVLFLIGVLLFVITFAVNLTADFVDPRHPEEVAMTLDPSTTAASRGRHTWRARSARRRSPRAFFAAMAAAMIVPLLLIVGYLVWRAWPALGLEFLLDVPAARHDRGRHLAGLRRHDLPGRALAAVSAPIGVLAAVYLNEYASDNWFNRDHQPGGDQPGRRAEHRARAVRPGRLRLRRALRLLDPLRLAHAGHHDAAGDHRQHARGAGLACRWRSARPAGTSAPRAGRRSAPSCCRTRSAAS